ncbi:hypothetical protein M2650_09825 [Luteimonas sp. SX5]|uniref:Sel1 repeat family protein n=1 Tax=Luteimonas galliterrae TaxID=2940486 RepID=A0ABT0MJ79_9GAMM|nr:hypothetical protein [Luteimonas galliterrae]MCL1634926.1 hypothetical protein [Luteimonas galliterrae]
MTLRLHPIIHDMSLTTVEKVVCRLRTESGRSITDMNSKSIYGLLIAIAIGAAILLLGRTPRTVGPAAAKQPAVQAQAKPVESAPPVASAAPVQMTTAVAFAGFPASVAQDPARRYTFAKDCAKFRHFDAFYREQSADPSWPLNSPKALAAADPELRSKLLETSRFLDQHRQSCKLWLEATPQDLANAQIYEASLQAALRGDQNAAACFVMAAWQKPNEQSPYHAGLVKAYAAHARRFVQDGLKIGSWPIVLAAFQATEEQHGLQTTAGFSAQDTYLLARLAQQGSPDALGESQYGYQAANAARNLTAADLIALDKRASDLFVNQFERKKVSVQSVTDMCVN